MSSKKIILPFFISPPGDTLKEQLEFIGVSPTKFAESIGIKKNVIYGIIRGKIPIDDEIANKFDSALGIPASFWINRERNYQNDLSEFKVQKIRI